MDICSTTQDLYLTYNQAFWYDDPKRFLVYKFLPACNYLDDISPGVNMFRCSESSSCTDTLFASIKSFGGFDAYHKGLQVIGIALDGHAIYGPYNEDHELWTCEDHDICNGRFFPEMDNSYAYVTTSTHPYTVGCIGPGPNAIFAQRCSINTCHTSAVQSF